MTLSSWDFGGQHIYHATHQFFLSDRALFILAWNARQGWEQARLTYWLDMIQVKAPTSPVLVVATHVDERNAELPTTELLRRYPQIAQFIQASPATGFNVEELREHVRSVAANLPLMGYYWPRSWTIAADKISDMDSLHSTPARIEETLHDAGIPKDTHNLFLRVLHQLGDILYFDDDEQLQDLIILRPQWLTEHVARVLDSEEVLNSGGILRRSHMRELWSDLEPELQNHFLRLMERFDLSYRTLDENDMSLVVELLSLDPPSLERWRSPIVSDTNPEDYLDIGEISIRYRLSSLPPGVPTWFIARSHRFTTYTHGRSGALLPRGSQVR